MSLRKVVVSSVVALVVALAGTGVASARVSKATLSCSQATTFSGVNCVITNNTRRPMEGTFSSPDAGTAPLTFSIPPLSAASVGVGFAPQTGVLYHFVWQGHGFSAAATVQF